MKERNQQHEKIYLYKAPNGEVPFLKFLVVTDDKIRKKLEYWFKCLALFPEFMTEPHVKHFSIARYNALYEYRERIRILVRIIFVLDKNGDIVILHPFVKKHDRNTMQALESSLRVLSLISDSPESLVQYEWKEAHGNEKTS